MPQLQRPDPEGLPRVVTYAEALTAGMSRHEVRTRVRTGRWLPLALGIYLREELDHENPFEKARQQHVLESLAAARRVTGSTVAFGSAALVHGMQLASGVPKRHELVVPTGHWNGVRASTRVRLATLEPVDVRSIAHVPVTAPARTWVDVTRGGSLGDALSAGDSALRSGIVTRDELAAALGRHEAQRGLRTAGSALPLLNPLRENALESKSYATFVDWGLPLPECQVEIWGERGFIGRVDFLWRAARLIGEADGRLKYGDPAAHYAEKLREDELRAEGWGVVRWGWRLDDTLRSRLTRLLTR